MLRRLFPKTSLGPPFTPIRMLQSSGRPDAPPAPHSNESDELQTDRGFTPKKQIQMLKAQTWQTRGKGHTGRDCTAGTGYALKQHASLLIYAGWR